MNPSARYAKTDAPPPDVAVRSVAAVVVDPDAPIQVPDEVRLFATDLDGTLLRSDHSLGEVTIDAIRDAQREGPAVVFVTGRPPRWLGPIVEATGHAGVAVCANGAVVLDVREAKVISARPLSSEAATAVGQRLRQLVDGMSFAVELIDGDAPDALRLTRLGYEPEYDPPWKNLPGVQEGRFEDLVAGAQPVKILGMPPSDVGLDADELVSLVTAEFGEALHVTHSGTLQPIIEIMGPGVDKGSGLAIAADYLALDASGSVAVGDMPNDLAMLAWAEHRYAVANAHAQVRSLAHQVVPSNEDDGAGRLLRAIIQKRRDESRRTHL